MIMARTKGSKNKSKPFTLGTDPEQAVAGGTLQPPGEPVVVASAPMDGPVTPGAEETEDERWARIKARRDANKASRDTLGAVGEQKLVAPTRAGFYRRWINDDGNRVAVIKNKGYDFVRKGSDGCEDVFSDDPGDRISQLVGKTKTNEPMRAYLMEIPSEWRDEDQESKETHRRAVEEDIRRAAKGGGKNLGVDGSSILYDPTHGSSQFS